MRKWLGFLLIVFLLITISPLEVMASNLDTWNADMNISIADVNRAMAVSDTSFNTDIRPTDVTNNIEDMIANSFQHNSSSLRDPNILERLIGGLLGVLPQLLLVALGLKDIVSLIYGYSGLDTFIYGKLPPVWGTFSDRDYNNVIVPIHTSVTAIAWGLVLIIIMLTALQMARSGVSSVKRVKLYNHIEDWIVGSILLTFNFVLIGLLFRLSLGFTWAFAPPDAQNIDFFGFRFPNSLSDQLGGLLAYPLIMFAILGLGFALNFIYIQRFFVLMAYISLSPLFCVTWFHDKTRFIFNNFWKELITNIFMPVFHAMSLYFYWKIAHGSSASAMAQLMILIIMIPMSDMLRNMLGAGGTGKGLKDGLMLGLGLGASVGLIRSVAGLGQAAIAAGTGGIGGLAMAGGSMAMSGAGGTMASMANNIAPSAPGVARVLGDNPAFQAVSQRIASGRMIGAGTGRVFGALAGSVFGASMGNNMAAAIGSMTGSEMGSKQGAGLGGKLSLAPEKFASMRSSTSDNLYQTLGSSSVMEDVIQQKNDADGNPMYEMEEKPTGVFGTGGQPINNREFKLDGNGNKIPVMEVVGQRPVVGSVLAQVFGQTNMANLEAQALAGTFAGRGAMNRLQDANAMASAKAQSNLPNPNQISLQSGNVLQKVTTNSGSIIYRMNGDGSREFLDATPESNPNASTSTPYITVSRFVEKDGLLKNDVLWQGFNEHNPRGTAASSLLNKL